MAASLDHRITSRSKVVTSAQAVRLIRDGDTVATSGLVGMGFAEEISIAIETRFTAGDGPHGLTLVYPGPRRRRRQGASTTWRTRAWCGEAAPLDERKATKMLAYVVLFLSRLLHDG